MRIKAIVRCSPRGPAPTAGCPPWDKPRRPLPRGVRRRSRMGSRCSRAEVDVIATKTRSRRRSPTRRRGVPLEDAGRHQSRASSVRRDDGQPQHEEVQAVDASGRRSSRPRTTRSPSTSKLFARIAAVHAARESRASPRSSAAGRAALRSLRAHAARSCRPRRRRSSARSTRSSPACSRTSATRCSPTRTPGS
jgi:hypothetical protein